MMDNTELNRKSKIQNGLFYGYIIVAICFFLQMFMFAPRGSFGVFIKPLSSEFDWSRALISGAFSVSSFVQGSSSILMGWLNDKLGPRVVLTICGILLGTGLILMYWVNSVWQLYVIYSVLIGLGMGGIYSPQMSTVARWFNKRRNVMTGLLMAGGGLGGLIGPPLITWLVYNQGWRDTFLFVGLFVFLFIVIAAQFLRRDPSKMGQVPYGQNNEILINTPSNVTGLTLIQALRTRRYWMFAGAIICFGFCFSTILVHIVPNAIDRGLSPATAANVLSAMNGAMTAGSLIVGLVADKIGGRRAFIFSFGLLSSVIFLLLPINSPWLMGLFVVMLAFGSGGVAVLESTMVAEIFGMKSHGAILGTIVFSFSMGASLGPYIAGLIFDNTGSYQWSFMICTVLSIIALFTALSLNRMRGQSSIKT